MRKTCMLSYSDPSVATFTHGAVNAQALIEYAKRHGHVLAADEKGPMGVTPLHLAALLPDNGAMAELLVLQCLPGEPPSRNLSPAGYRGVDQELTHLTKNIVSTATSSGYLRTPPPPAIKGKFLTPLTGA